MSVNSLAKEEDRPAYVRFERRAVENKAETLKMGRSVSFDVDFALITPPYSKDLIVLKVPTFFENTERDVRNGRTPEKWMDAWKNAYQKWQNGQEVPLNGTPIKTWSAISPAQIKNLIAIGILTIEDLAQCNDEGIRRIGMGGIELRKTASNWLTAANDHGPLTLKVTQLERENSRLLTTNDDLVEKNRILNSRLESFRQPEQAYVAPVEEISMSDIMDEPAPIVRDNTLTHNNIPEKGRVMSESLADQYIAKFGKKPHWKMLDETIRQKLEA